MPFRAWLSTVCSSAWRPALSWRPKKGLSNSARSDHKPPATLEPPRMIRSVSRFAGTALALAILAGPALAQQAAPQAPQAAQPSASQLALAREVALGSGMTRSFDSITDQMLEQMSQMNVTRPEIKQDLDQVIEILRPEMDQQKQVMVNSAARIFAARMSEAELKDVANFFKSPSGLKYVQ